MAPGTIACQAVCIKSIRFTTRLPQNKLYSMQTVSIRDRGYSTEMLYKINILAADALQRENHGENILHAERHLCWWPGSLHTRLSAAMVLTILCHKTAHIACRGSCREEYCVIRSILWLLMPRLIGYQWFKSIGFTIKVQHTNLLALGSTSQVICIWLSVCCVLLLFKPILPIGLHH